MWVLKWSQKIIIKRKKNWTKWLYTKWLPHFRKPNKNLFYNEAAVVVVNRSSVSDYISWDNCSSYQQKKKKKCNQWSDTHTESFTYCVCWYNRHVRGSRDDDDKFGRWFHSHMQTPKKKSSNQHYGHKKECCSKIFAFYVNFLLEFALQTKKK